MHITFHSNLLAKQYEKPPPSEIQRINTWGVTNCKKLCDTNREEKLRLGDKIQRIYWRWICRINSCLLLLLLLSIEWLLTDWLLALRRWSEQLVKLLLLSCPQSAAGSLSDCEEVKTCCQLKESRRGLNDDQLRTCYNSLAGIEKEWKLQSRAGMKMTRICAKVKNKKQEEKPEEVQEVLCKSFVLSSSCTCQDDNNLGILLHLQVMRTLHRMTCRHFEEDLISRRQATSAGIIFSEVKMVTKYVTPSSQSGIRKNPKKQLERRVPGWPAERSWKRVEKDEM